MLTCLIVGDGHKLSKLNQEIINMDDLKNHGQFLTVSFAGYFVYK